jgi:hypothetical protein
VDERGKPRRNKLLVRSTTNAYFPQNGSAISIPREAVPASGASWLANGASWLASDASWLASDASWLASDAS